MKRVAEKVAEELKKRVDIGEIIDVGVGAEREYAVTRERFRKALKILQNDGYFITVFCKKDAAIENGKKIVIKLLSKNSIETVKEFSKNWRAFYKRRLAIVNGDF